MNRQDQTNVNTQAPGSLSRIRERLSAQMADMGSNFISLGAKFMVLFCAIVGVVVLLATQGDRIGFTLGDTNKSPRTSVEVVASASDGLVAENSTQDPGALVVGDSDLNDADQSGGSEALSNNELDSPANGVALDTNSGPAEKKIAPKPRAVKPPAKTENPKPANPTPPTTKRAPTTKLTTTTRLTTTSKPTTTTSKRLEQEQKRFSNVVSSSGRDWVSITAKVNGCVSDPAWIGVERFEDGEWLEVAQEACDGRIYAALPTKPGESVKVRLLAAGKPLVERTITPI